MAQELTKQGELIGVLWTIVEPPILAANMEVLDIEYCRESLGWVLRIFLDAQGGITVEDCAGISRLVGDMLDSTDVIPNPYHLEVSSPGIDRPLRKIEHFQNHIDDIIEVRTISPVENRRKFKGALKEVSQQAVTVQCESRDYSIDIELIERARLLYFESMERRAR